jgi:hypothetical protein
VTKRKEIDETLDEVKLEEPVTPKFISVAVHGGTIVGLDDEMSIWEWTNVPVDVEENHGKKYKMRWIKLVSEI